MLLPRYTQWFDFRRKERKVSKRRRRGRMQYSCSFLLLIAAPKASTSISKTTEVRVFCCSMDGWMDGCDYQPEITLSLSHTHTVVATLNSTTCCWSRLWMNGTAQSPQDSISTAQQGSQQKITDKSRRRRRRRRRSHYCWDEMILTQMWAGHVVKNSFVYSPRPRPSSYSFSYFLVLAAHLRWLWRRRKRKRKQRKKKCDNIPSRSLTWSIMWRVADCWYYFLVPVAQTNDETATGIVHKEMLNPFNCLRWCMYLWVLDGGGWRRRDLFGLHREGRWSIHLPGLALPVDFYHLINFLLVCFSSSSSSRVECVRSRRMGRHSSSSSSSSWPRRASTVHTVINKCQVETRDLKEIRERVANKMYVPAYITYSFRCRHCILCCREGKRKRSKIAYRFSPFAIKRHVVSSCSTFYFTTRREKK